IGSSRQGRLCSIARRQASRMRIMMSRRMPPVHCSMSIAGPGLPSTERVVRCESWLNGRNTSRVASNPSNLVPVYCVSWNTSFQQHPPQQGSRCILADGSFNSDDWDAVALLLNHWQVIEQEPVQVGRLAHP